MLYKVEAAYSIEEEEEEEEEEERLFNKTHAWT